MSERSVTVAAPGVKMTMCPIAKTSPLVEFGIEVEIDPARVTANTTREALEQTFLILMREMFK